MLLAPFLTSAILLLSGTANAFPAYQSLAGWSREDVDLFIREHGDGLVGAQPAPPKLNDTSVKLAYDDKHPYMAPGPDDIRGPCPGLNTLANHGYINRSGIVTPQEIVTAVQEGFNMEWEFGVFVTWMAFLVDGNLLTNRLSIGAKSPRTGVDPPSPATVGGLNTHNLFEGDASTTREDFEFGDNYHFNETLFQQFVETSKKYGAGKYNQTVAAEVRWNRIQDSIARNPNFTFLTPRIFVAYAESIFIYRFFVDGRETDAALDMTSARSFSQHAMYPKDFHRRNGTFGFANIQADFTALEKAHPFSAGQNSGIGNYVPSTTDSGLNGGACGVYTKQVNVVIPSLYPFPDEPLRKALQAGVKTLFSGLLPSMNCTELFPFGQD